MGSRFRWWRMLESEGEDWMIKQIVKALKAKEVYAYKIEEKSTISHQAFFVLGKLETNRMVNTNEYLVTVYKQFDEFLGSSSFTLSHKVSKKELETLIDNCLYAASFVKNKKYDLPVGEKKKTFTEKPLAVDVNQAIDQIAHCFIDLHEENIRFNALEIFYNTTKTTLVNSNGVNYSKTLSDVMGEAIPSFDGVEKVELYKQFHYKDLDFDAIKRNAVEALEDVKARYAAKPIKDVSKLDVILSNEDILEFFRNVIMDYSYQSIYKGNTNKRIGDLIQDENANQLINLSLMPSSKADGFDDDGILLNKFEVIKDGRLVNYFGGAQYASYLDLKPLGSARKIYVSKGKTSYKEMTKKPYLRIIALSGIQIETYSDYIGGEVRLAIYFDGEKEIPVSSFSFSGSYKEALKTLSLSKEEISIRNYQGPKYLKIKDMDIL